MADRRERRGAIIRLHAEGWNIASSAGYLEAGRPTVCTTLKRGLEDGVDSLDDKPLGIKPSPRIRGRILARNRKLYGLRGLEAKPREPKAMPPWRSTESRIARITITCARSTPRASTRLGTNLHSSPSGN